MITIREYKCGCRITSEKNYPSIDYCPLHKAAPEMYEALKRGLDALESAFQIIGSDDSFFVKHSQELLMFMKQTLAKVENKEERDANKMGLG